MSAVATLRKAAVAASRQCDKDALNVVASWLASTSDADASAPHIDESFMTLYTSTDSSLLQGCFCSAVTHICQEVCGLGGTSILSSVGKRGRFLLRDLRLHKDAWLHASSDLLDRNKETFLWCTLSLLLSANLTTYAPSSSTATATAVKTLTTLGNITKHVDSQVRMAAVDTLEWLICAYTLLEFHHLSSNASSDTDSSYVGIKAESSSTTTTTTTTSTTTTTTSSSSLLSTAIDTLQTYHQQTVKSVDSKSTNSLFFLKEIEALLLCMRAVIMGLVIATEVMLTSISSSNNPSLHLENYLTTNLHTYLGTLCPTLAISWISQYSTSPASLKAKEEYYPPFIREASYHLLDACFYAADLAGKLRQSFLHHHHSPTATALSFISSSSPSSSSVLVSNHAEPHLSDQQLTLLMHGNDDVDAQVRFAASVASRTAISLFPGDFSFDTSNIHVCNNTSLPLSMMLPRFCFNRYFGGERQRMYSVDTWKKLVTSLEQQQQQQHQPSTFRHSNDATNASNAKALVSPTTSSSTFDADNFSSRSSTPPIITQQRQSSITSAESSPPTSSSSSYPSYFPSYSPISDGRSGSPLHRALERAATPPPLLRSNDMGNIRSNNTSALQALGSNGENVKSPPSFVTSSSSPSSSGSAPGSASPSWASSHLSSAAAAALAPGAEGISTIGPLLVSTHISPIVHYYIRGLLSSTPAIVEAACHCVSELSSKIDVEAVRPYATKLLVLLLQVIRTHKGGDPVTVESLSSAAGALGPSQWWPVRDAALVASGKLFTNFFLPLVPIRCSNISTGGNESKASSDDDNHTADTATSDGKNTIEIKDEHILSESASLQQQQQQQQHLLPLPTRSQCQSMAFATWLTALYDPTRSVREHAAMVLALVLVALNNEASVTTCLSPQSSSSPSSGSLSPVSTLPHGHSTALASSDTKSPSVSTHKLPHSLFIRKQHAESSLSPSSSPSALARTPPNNKSPSMSSSPSFSSSSTEIQPLVPALVYVASLALQGRIADPTKFLEIVQIEPLSCCWDQRTYIWNEDCLGLAVETQHTVEKEAHIDTACILEGGVFLTRELCAAAPNACVSAGLGTAPSSSSSSSLIVSSHNNYDHFLPSPSPPLLDLLAEIAAANTTTSNTTNTTNTTTNNNSSDSSNRTATASSVTDTIWRILPSCAQALGSKRMKRHLDAFLPPLAQATNGSSSSSGDDDAVDGNAVRMRRWTAIDCARQISRIVGATIFRARAENYPALLVALSRDS